MSGECLGNTFGVSVGGMYGKYVLGICLGKMEHEWPPGAWAEDLRLSYVYHCFGAGQSAITL